MFISAFRLLNNAYAILARVEFDRGNMSWNDCLLKCTLVWKAGNLWSPN